MTTRVANSIFPKPGLSSTSARGANRNSRFFWLQHTSKIEPLHPDAGTNMSCPQFSADGKHLAFGTGERENRAIWVQDLERNTTSKLTSTPMSSCPVWTPDNRHVLLQSTDQRGSGIYWIRRDHSGEPQRRAMMSAVFRHPSPRMGNGSPWSKRPPAAGRRSGQRRWREAASIRGSVNRRC